MPMAMMRGAMCRNGFIGGSAEWEQGGEGMAHQYRQRILVTLRANGEPGGILWRGAAYSVAEVLAHWHLRDRWWEAREDQADVAGDLATETEGTAGVHRPPLQDAGHGRHRGHRAQQAAPLQGRADGSRGLKHDDTRSDSCETASSTGDRRSMPADFSPPEPCVGTSVPRLNHTPSDRYYYRLRCVEGLLCEVYWDAACDAWTLDRVLD